MSAWSLSCVWLFAALGIVAHQEPLSMEFSREEYWGGLPFPPPDYLWNYPPKKQKSVIVTP